MGRGPSGEVKVIGGGRPALLLALAAIIIPTALLVNRVVPDAYLDEEFHVRQVQHYCRGDFEHWDPKITTFPGLYILSLVYLRPLALLSEAFGLGGPWGDAYCRPDVLRSINVGFSFICALLFREIVLHLDPKKDKYGASVKALVLSLYPLHWFFTFLYYTEMGSAVAVMGMYLASLKRAYWISALLGALSLLLRQTNATWVVFVLCVGILDFVQHDDDVKEKRALQEDDVQLATGYQGRDRTARSESKPSSDETESLFPQPGDSGQKDGIRKRPSFRGYALRGKGREELLPVGSKDKEPMLVNSGIIPEVWDLAKGVWTKLYEILWNFGPLVLVFLAFVGFVFYNGGIVVGDKSAHRASLHFAQLLYFALVSAGFQAAIYASPQNLHNHLRFLKTSSKRNSFACCIIFSAAAFVAIRYFSAAHPYLLADNRHFVFYIWKDLLQKHRSTKYALIPAYLVSWWSILALLRKRQTALWVMTFVLAIAGTLVPAPLLEFRYFNVPFYILFLHTCQDMSYPKLLFTAVEFMAVNVATVYMFLSWPFEWKSEPGKLQRFMW